MKKNQQLAKQVNQVHEQWARDNGYRGKATSNKRGKQQASSHKHQAPSSSKKEQQASSVKHKGSSFKPQASSAMIPDPGKSFTDL